MTEIVECGDLVQDNDGVTPQSEAEWRWNRYVALADSVTGFEGADGVSAIVRSLRSDEDYGAYQAAHLALSRFPGVDLGTGLADAAANLLAMRLDHSGNLFLILTHGGRVAVGAFDSAMASKSITVRNAVVRLVEFHESEEWLSEEGRRNVLLMPRGRFVAGES